MITKLLSGFMAGLLPYVLSGIVCAANLTIYNISYVNAAQLSCDGDPVLLEGQYPYSLIQDAYEDISPGTTGTISLQAVEFEENLTFNQNVTVILRGGLDCDFLEQPVSSYSIIDSMIISNGTIFAENIILKDVVVYWASLPDTGQQTSLTDTYGEDHDYTINPPSYTLNSNGTTTDNVTGLMWQSIADDVSFNWYEASGTPDAEYNPGGVVDVCGDLSLASYNDWRLPSENELLGIVNYDLNSPAIDLAYFPGTTSHGYWSSTTHALYEDEAWIVDFGFPYIPYGSVSYDSKISPDYKVMCVRGGQTSQSFTDNGDGTVTDMKTGLTWQQGDSSQSRSWEEALTYCENLELPVGQTDWRLPNIKELRSIIDTATHSPAIDLTNFPDTNLGDYWSSTHGWTYSHHNGTYTPSGAWAISLSISHDDGYVNKLPTSSNAFARCVRGGQ